MGLAVTVANDLLDALVNNESYAGPATVYLSLHTGDVGTNGAAEVSTGGYGREVIDFAAAASGSVASSATIEFEDMPAVTLTHFGLWSAGSGGSFLTGGALTSSVPVGAGNTVRFAAGNVSLSLT